MLHVPFAESSVRSHSVGQARGKTPLSVLLCFFTEVEAGLNDFRVVEYHQAVFGEVFGKRGKHVFGYCTLTVYEQF